MKRTLTMLLCALMLVVPLAGCGQTMTPDPSPSASPVPVVEYDWEAAWTTHEPDEVVMTINGDEVTWEQYYYWMRYEYLSYCAGYGLYEQVPNGDDMTIEEFLKQDVEFCARQYHVIDQIAAENSIELTDDDRAVLAEQLQNDIVEYVGEDGTEEELMEYLDGEHVSRELYDFINSKMVLYPRLFISLYGETGEKMSDEDTMAFAEKYGYITVKHILFLTTDENGDDLSDEEKEAKRSEAQAVLDEVNAVPEADREALFTELMNEKSEDTGLASYPNGYCYAPDASLVQEFKDAAAELEVGGISGIVETDYGYHILMRVQTTPEDLVLMNTLQPFTLRYAAAVMAFNTMYSEAVQSAEVAYTDAFKDFMPSDVLTEK